MLHIRILRLFRREKVNDFEKASDGKMRVDSLIPHPGSARYVDPDDCASINILIFFGGFHNSALTGLGRCAKASVQFENFLRIVYEFYRVGFYDRALRESIDQLNRFCGCL